ncbi:MAG: hypothetical protein NTU53_24570 [Planctomycetota bacterium]|nr:hypothetical protein [Planctomycetota bacterium]
MRRTRVKICGMMRGEHAVCACEAGVDAIGMIFHPPARRHIEVGRAREIVGVLGPFVTPVGVFVDASTETVLSVAREVGIRGRAKGACPLSFDLTVFTAWMSTRVELGGGKRVAGSWIVEEKQYDLGEGGGDLGDGGDPWSCRPCCRRVKQGQRSGRSSQALHVTQPRQQLIEGICNAVNIR